MDKTNTFCQTSSKIDAYLDFQEMFSHIFIFLWGLGSKSNRWVLLGNTWEFLILSSEIQPDALKFRGN